MAKPNPPYPALNATVAKFRRQESPNPKAYGRAVRAAVRALHRAELMRARTPKTMQWRPDVDEGQRPERLPETPRFEPEQRAADAGRKRTHPDARLECDRAMLGRGTSNSLA